MDVSGGPAPDLSTTNHLPFENRPILAGQLSATVKTMDVSDTPQAKGALYNAEGNQFCFPVDRLRYADRFLDFTTHVLAYNEKIKQVRPLAYVVYKQDMTAFIGEIDERTGRVASNKYITRYAPGGEATVKAVGQGMGAVPAGGRAARREARQRLQAGPELRQGRTLLRRRAGAGVGTGGAAFIGPPTGLLLVVLCSGCQHHEPGARPSNAPTGRPARAEPLEPLKPPMPLTRPPFVVCERGEGPARPLTEAEALWWCPREFDKRKDYIDLEEVDLRGGDAEVKAMSNADVGYPQLLAMLAQEHHDQYERYAARACSREFNTDGGPRMHEIRGDWERADAHLHAALEMSVAGLRFVDRLSPTLWGNAACVAVVSAARLRRLSEALEVRGRLAADRPCTPWALLWLAHALDGAGRHAEARAALEQALELDHEGSPHKDTCTVAPSTPVDNPSIDVVTAPFHRYCTWNIQLRYMLAWTDYHGGSASREATAAVLTAIAARLDGELDLGAPSMLATLKADILRLGVAAPPQTPTPRN